MEHQFHYHLNMKRDGSCSTDDLLRTAEEHDLRRSRPWARTLVDDGLIDRPRNHGIRGRRGGRAPATWPQSQFQLFVALLEQMRNGVGRRELCHLPVELWLRAGPDAVPVRQVRRVLRTYSRSAVSRREAKETAVRLAQLYAGGDEASRESRILTSALTSLDRDQFLEAGGRLVDPEENGRALGPTGLEMDHETHALVLDSYLTGLASLDDADDDIFTATRDRYLQIAQAFPDLRTQLLSDPEVGEAVAQTSPDALTEHPCPYVLMLIGQLILERQGNKRKPAQMHQLWHRFAQGDTKPPPRPRQRPGGTAHGKDPSACKRSVPPPPRAALSSPTATASSST